jgi:hypothetical protein
LAAQGSKASAGRRVPRTPRKRQLAGSWRPGWALRVDSRLPGRAGVRRVEGGARPEAGEHRPARRAALARACQDCAWNARRWRALERPLMGLRPAARRPAPAWPPMPTGSCSRLILEHVQRVLLLRGAARQAACLPLSDPLGQRGLRGQLVRTQRLERDRAHAACDTAGPPDLNGIAPLPWVPGAVSAIRSCGPLER